MRQLTDYQLQLLLILEDFAATNYGRVNQSHLSGQGWDQCDEWDKEGFIMFRGNPSKHIPNYWDYCVALSDEAWDLAHLHRRAKGKADGFLREMAEALAESKCKKEALTGA